ncbi:MAG: hypothetical protein WAO55_13950 [Candidatus Manganitrophaceae bacterium]
MRWLLGNLMKRDACESGRSPLCGVFKKFINRIGDFDSGRAGAALRADISEDVFDIRIKAFSFEVEGGLSDLHQGFTLGTRFVFLRKSTNQ